LTIKYIELPPSGITLLSQSLPRNPALYAAHPNPFNPTTLVSFELRAASHVNLIIYDTLGRPVASLVNRWKSAGVHKTIFDGSALPSGIYLAKLTAGDFSAVQKLILLK